MRTREREALVGAQDMARAARRWAREHLHFVATSEYDGGQRRAARWIVGLMNREIAKLNRLLDPARSARAKKAAATRRKRRKASSIALAGPPVRGRAFEPVGKAARSAASRPGRRARGEVGFGRTVRAKAKRGRQ